MPLSKEKQRGAETGNQYVLDINRHFVELSGKARAVPIRYDLIVTSATEKTGLTKLETLLDNLDAVLFTGGFLPLKVVEEGTKESKIFYQTAKTIFKYALRDSLPILGVCQGF